MTWGVLIWGSENIPPFHSIKGSDFHARSCQVFFTHIRKVCSFLLCPKKPAELEQLQLLSTPSQANSNAYKKHFTSFTVSSQADQDIP